MSDVLNMIAFQIKANCSSIALSYRNAGPFVCAHPDCGAIQVRCVSVLQRQGGRAGERASRKGGETEGGREGGKERRRRRREEEDEELFKASAVNEVDAERDRGGKERGKGGRGRDGE
jgi:hypothetical protein